MMSKVSNGASCSPLCFCQVNFVKHRLGLGSVLAVLLDLSSHAHNPPQSQRPAVNVRPHKTMKQCWLWPLLHGWLCVCGVWLLPCVHLQVWDVSSGAVVFEVGSKSVNKEAWPLLQWSQGDAALFHGVTNTVHQYTSTDGFKGEESEGE